MIRHNYCKTQLRLLSLRSLILALLGSGVALSGSGCGQGPKPIETGTDALLRAERKAIERLTESGCKVIETEDELVGSNGIMVTLFPEHLKPDGHLDPDILRELRDLRKCFLIVDGTPVSAAGFSELRTLNNLLLLSAQFTNIGERELEQIEGIVSLRLLRLSRTKVSDDGLRHIERLPELVMLYLSHNAITDQGIEHVVQLQRLKALQLSGTRIGDPSVVRLSELTDLEYLGLDKTQVTDASLSYLGRLKKLKYLNLSGTKITHEGLQKLKTALPNCKIVQDVLLEA